jgi:hypothetical protein
MKELIEQIKPLVEDELKRSNEKFSQFADAHHGAAILFEEIQESGEEFENITTAFTEIWTATKHNYINKDCFDLEVLKKSAINLAAEAIQTAAMAQKFLDMLEREGK